MFIDIYKCSCEQIYLKIPILRMFNKCTKISVNFVLNDQVNKNKSSLNKTIT